MEDLFLEQMVKRGNGQKDMVSRILIVICGILIISVPFMFSLTVSYYVTPVLVLAVGLLIWIMWRRVAKEYEYIFTSGNLDFDVIYGRSSRQTLVTFDCRQARMIVPADDPKYAHEIYDQKYDRTIYAIPDKPDANTYVVIGKVGDKQYRVFFQPNEKMQAAIMAYSPKNTIIRNQIEEKAE